MEKRVLLTELVDRGSHLRKEITPTAVVTDDGKYTAGTFWDANKTLNEIVHGATEAQDTLKEVEDKLNNEIATARNAEQALSDRMDDILGIDALDIADLKSIVEDLDPETGILSVIDSKASKEEVDLLKDDISIEAQIEDANGHDYVEIAGIKWATMNVGAQSVTDGGLYFAWGETTGYTAEQVGVDKNFTWDDYELTEDGGSTMSKYNSADGKTVLELTDDAAAVNMGGSWRMPTKEEWQTLSQTTNFEYVNNYNNTGIKGLVCTDKTDSSKVLFFPAEGRCSSGNITSSGACYYLSRSRILSESGIDKAYMTYFTDIDIYFDYYTFRYYGNLVRGVLGTTTSKVLGTTITDDERTKWNTVDNKANTTDLGTAAAKNVPTTGNASTTEVVMGNDSRLTDARTPVAHTHTTSDITDFPSSLPASDVSAWAKAANKPTYAYSEITDTPDLSLKANVSDISVTTTTTVNADDNGHTYVDLGLPSGTLWATMNVGASSITDYGNYYKYGLGASQYNNTQANYTGTENPLAASADTATQVWGGDWHMPTQAQLQELIDNTTYTWETNFNGSGINGGKFTAQNGNYVFFPAAGFFNNGYQDGVGSYGYYWSSTPRDNFAYGLNLNDGSDAGGRGVQGYNRKGGRPIRPVLPGPTTSTSTVLGKTATDAEKAAWNAKSNFSGSYDDLTNKPNVVTSTTTGLKIEVVASMPVSPDANTIYIVQ